MPEPDDITLLKQYAVPGRGSHPGGFHPAGAEGKIAEAKHRIDLHRLKYQNLNENILFWIIFDGKKIADAKGYPEPK